MLLYQDESHFRDSQTLHSTWFLKGKQKKVPGLGKYHALSIFGAVNVNTGDFLCAKADKCNAETFQAFLEYVLEKYENSHVVLVLDNARYHHAKILKPFIQENEERLTLIYLPPYSPNLNLVERVLEVNERYNFNESLLRKSRRPRSGYKRFLS